jgi:hypothetical protein
MTQDRSGHPTGFHPPRAARGAPFDARSGSACIVPSLDYGTDSSMAIGYELVPWELGW